MSRKAKQSKTHAKPIPPHVMGTPALVAEVETALAASRHRQAIEFYKELIKRERRPDWVDGLASCYAGRAHELAAKGMVKEALVLWRNRTELCGKPLAEGPYFAWLLEAGQQEEMVRLLADKTLPEAVLAELETRLAATVLAAPDGALPGLPADSALLRHRTPAREALAAYHRGDLAAMGEQLHAIPFRSPYRDLKPILKALALLQTDTGAAPAAQAIQGAIARLPDGGPFERLVAAMRVAVLPAGRWLAALRGLDEDSRQLVLDIKGCPDTLRPLLLELAALGASPDAAPLFDLLIRHRRALPEGVAAGLCRRLLPHAPNRLRNHADVFGGLQRAELEHIAALAAEQQGERSLAASHWARMAEILGKDPAQSQRAALIWRHLAGGGRHGALDADAVHCLKQSVALDPDDRDSQLKLIGALRLGGDLPQARACLDQALPRFPKDAGVLLEAVEVALAGKAFKKAVGLAKQVVELDPINPQVRALIGHAHFSHARKQIKAFNYAAARKELDAAEEWLRAPADRATLKLLRALAADGGADDSNAQIREAVAEMANEMGGALVGGLHLLLEAGKVGSDPSVLLLRGGVDLVATPAPDAVVAFAQALNAARDGDKALRAALEPLRPALRRAAKGEFSEPDQRLVCEALQRRKENELLRVYAEAALKRWPKHPVFIYLRAMASYADRPYQIPPRMQYELEHAADEALKQGDRRTSQRIHDLLYPPEKEIPFFEDEDDFAGQPLGDDPRAMFEMLLNMGGEDALLNMARQAMGKQAFLELKKLLGGNKKEFASALIDLMVQQVPPGDIAPPPIDKPPPRAPRRPPPEIQKDLFDD